MKKRSLPLKVLSSGIVIIFIGAIYLFLQLIDLLSSASNLIDPSENGGTINWHELLFDLRTYVYIVLGLAGGIGLILGKKWGWILGVPYLVLYLIISSWGIIRLASMNMMEEGGYILIGAWLVLAAALLALIVPSSMASLKLKPAAFVPASLILLLLVLFYFYLQLK